MRTTSKAELTLHLGAPKFIKGKNKFRILPSKNPWRAARPGFSGARGVCLLGVPRQPRPSQQPSLPAQLAAFSSINKGTCSWEKHFCPLHLPDLAAPGQKGLVTIRRFIGRLVCPCCLLCAGVGWEEQLSLCDAAGWLLHFLISSLDEDWNQSYRFPETFSPFFNGCPMFPPFLWPHDSIISQKSGYETKCQLNPIGYSWLKVLEGSSLQT